MNDLYNEKELLSELRRGNQQSLRLIYNSSWKPLFISAYNMLKDREACEDVVQEVFLHLWQNRKTLLIHTSLKSYLFTAVRFQVLRRIRRDQKKLEIIADLAPSAPYRSPLEDLEGKDTLLRLKTAVNSLPEKCKLIYQLSREQFYTHKEIAAKLHISEKTVENQLTIALKRIKKVLASG